MEKRIILVTIIVTIVTEVGKRKTVTEDAGVRAHDIINLGLQAEIFGKPV